MTRLWWKYAGIRAIKTVCQTAIATIGTSMFVEDVNWLAVASSALLAGILSLLTSLAGIPEVDIMQVTEEITEMDSEEMRPDDEINLGDDVEHWMEDGEG